MERRQKIEEDEGMSYDQFSAMEMGWKWKHPIPMKEPLLLFMAANVLVAIHQWISAFKLKIIFGGICGMVSITLLLFIYWTYCCARTQYSLSVGIALSQPRAFFVRWHLPPFMARRDPVLSRVFAFTFSF